MLVSTDYTNPPRVKSIQIYRPNIYVYKFSIVNYPNGIPSSAQSLKPVDPSVLRDFLINAWTFYIEQILSITSSHYSVYAIVSSPSVSGQVNASSNTNSPLDIYPFVCAVYLIFDKGVFIPAFFNSGSNTASGFTTNPYTFLHETIPYTPISAPTPNKAYFKYNSGFIPWPLRLFGSYSFQSQFITAFNTNSTSYPSNQQVYELYGSGMNNYIPTSPWVSFFTNGNNVIGSSYRYTYEELGIDSFLHANQYINDLASFDHTDSVIIDNSTISLSQPPYTDGLSNGISPFLYSNKTYKNIPIILNANAVPTAPTESDTAETTVLVNEILQYGNSINLKVYMLQSPNLFIKYGEYLLYVYRFVRTKTIGPVNNI